jgi:hypothetical protein
VSSLRVTFITPHQRANSGGVYTIQQFARHLAGTMHVRLVVAKGETTELPGVTILGPEALRAGAVPDGDLLVIPADFRPAETVFGLSRDAGRRVAFFQGYGTPDDPQIDEILSECSHALVGAGWLVNEACRRGCEATLVRYGLDRAVFFPAARADSAGAPTVGMMASDAAWKGTADGVEALSRARDAIPELEVRIFGRSDPGIEGAAFLPAPPAGRPEIADLMRACDVFVCPSWEEGFGLPGLEALACGAALATTDTKGSRDYAFDEETALVSGPRDPEALARNVVALLWDPELRRAQVERARQHIDATYPPWPIAAAALADVLAMLCAT